MTGFQIDLAQSRAYRTRGGVVPTVHKHPHKPATFHGRVAEWNCTWDVSGRALEVVNNNAETPVSRDSFDLVAEASASLEERDADAASVQRAPRVTLDQIRSLVARERFFVDDTLTICVLTLTNGYKVTGESAAADPQNFNEELGRKIARDKAMAEVWPLAGYLLREQLHREEHPRVVRCKMVVSGQQPVVTPAPDAEWDPDQRAYDRIVPDGAIVNMTAVYASGAADGGNAVEENRIFGEATPYGMITMHIRNPAALAALRQGRDFYVDFTPAK